MKEKALSHRAAEAAARDSYGRLVSYLAWQWRDIAAAQDAMGSALLKALEVWPDSGIPDSPDAWLLAVAKRELLQVARHYRVQSDPAVSAVLAQETLVEDAPSIPDARLKLMFVCAHPAIDEKIRIPLMLQTVLGLQVADMAPALMLTPTTLAQRLVRAKQKIRDAAIRFEEPELRELPERLTFVLESIYGAFGLSMDAVDGAESRITDLQEEAVFLCDIVCQLLPEEPEALGLSALMKFIRARRQAQIDESGKFVSLAEQDVLLWDREAIVSADQTLWMAARQGRHGPFQLEAAIQSAHCHRMFTGITPWNGIAVLYEQINRYFPTQGSLVAGAVAIAEAGDLQAGVRQLEAMQLPLVKSFQPWWVAKAYLLSKGDASEREEADKAFQIAIGLTTQIRLKAHLQLLREGLRGNK